MAQKHETVTPDVPKRPKHRVTAREFFPKLIFSIVFVYVAVLGIFNLVIVANKAPLESLIARLLYAEKVSIGNVSNLPFVFVSTTEIVFKVNDELSISLQGVYFQYRFWTLFTGDYGRLIRSIDIETVTFFGHATVIGDYQRLLSERLLPDEPDGDIGGTDIAFESIHSSLNIKRTALKLNTMTEFWHTISVNNLNFGLNKGDIMWNYRILM